MMTHATLPMVRTDRYPTWAREANEIAQRSDNNYIVLAGRDTVLDALEPMIDWLESDRRLAAVTVTPNSVSSAQQLTLAPDPNLTVLRCKALLEADGLDVNYGGWGESLDLGWRWWLMGYTIGRLTPAEKLSSRPSDANSAIHLLHLTADQRYALMHRNWLWTIIKNRQESYFGQEISLALLDMLAAAYRQAHPEIVELPVQPALAPPAWKERLLSWLDPLRAAPRLRFSPDDPRLPLARVPRRLVTALVTANDIIEAMPILIQVRRKVQARRKRSDDEIEQQLGLQLPALIRRSLTDLYDRLPTCHTLKIRQEGSDD